MRKSEGSFWLAEQALFRELEVIRTENAKRQAAAKRADRIFSLVTEQSRAIDFNAGLTREQSQQLLETYGPGLWKDVIRILTAGEATTVETAIARIYQAAGDDAGKFADRLGGMTQKKVFHPLQPPTKWEELNQEIYDHEHPRRKKRRRGGKAENIARYQRWQERKKIQEDLDRSFENMLAELAGQPAPKG